MLKRNLKIAVKILLFAMIGFISLFFVLYLIVSWPKFFYDKDNFSQNFVKQCNGNFENCIVSADQVTDFDWDKMYVFSDSVKNSQISEILQVEYNNEKAEMKRRIIFTKNNEIVHEELFFYDPFDGPPSKTAFYEYGSELSPHYISVDRDDANFSIEIFESFYRIKPLY